MTDFALSPIAQRVDAALARAGAYFDACLAQRNPGPTSLGSVFREAQTRTSLTLAPWEPYAHPAVQAPAVAFKAPIPGLLGVVELEGLPLDLPVTLADPKGTGFLEATVELQGGRPAVDFTVLLLGPDRADPQVETLWTFFPGEPIAPSRLDVERAKSVGMVADRPCTVIECIAAGLRYAKVRP